MPVLTGATGEADGVGSGRTERRNSIMRKLLLSIALGMTLAGGTSYGFAQT